MRQNRRRVQEEAFVEPDFVEALCEEDSGKRSSDRQAQRKTKQFCRQVQRALNLALAENDASDGTNGLFIEEVSPAPDCGRLLAHVVIPADRSTADAIAALRRETPNLRSEVAKTIARKRTPELLFVPVFLGGADE